MIEEMKQVERALTLKRPWAQAIIYGPKRIENRRWTPEKVKPPFWMAIHAGQSEDKTAEYHMTSEGLYEVDPAHDHEGCIIGLARVTGYTTYSDDPWYAIGQVGWIIDEVYPLDPIKARGKLNLWPLSELHKTMIVQQIEAKEKRRAFLNDDGYEMRLIAAILDIDLEEATDTDRERMATLRVKLTIRELEDMAKRNGIEPPTP